MSYIILGNFFLVQGNSRCPQNPEQNPLQLWACVATRNWQRWKWAIAAHCHCGRWANRCGVWGRTLWFCRAGNYHVLWLCVCVTEHMHEKIKDHFLSSRMLQDCTENSKSKSKWLWLNQIRFLGLLTNGSNPMLRRKWNKGKDLILFSLLLLVCYFIYRFQVSLCRWHLYIAFSYSIHEHHQQTFLGSHPIFSSCSLTLSLSHGRTYMYTHRQKEKGYISLKSPFWMQSTVILKKRCPFLALMGYVN